MDMPICEDLANPALAISCHARREDVALRGAPISEINWRPCSTRSRLLGDYAAAFGWPIWLAGIQARPMPLRLSRLLGLRGSGRDEQQ